MRLGLHLPPASAEYIEPGSTTSVEKYFHGPTTASGDRHSYYDKLALAGLSDPFIDIIGTSPTYAEIIAASDITP
jgi:hypothetical protein